MVRCSNQRPRDTCLSTEQTVSNFKPLVSSIESVILVEASPALRDSQRQLLCGDATLEEIDIGFRCTSKHSGIPVTWCEDIRFVPNGRFCFVSPPKVLPQLICLKIQARHHSSSPTNSLMHFRYMPSSPSLQVQTKRPRFSLLLPGPFPLHN